MSTVAVCTDSSCLLSEAEAARSGVAIAPIAVALDGVPFAEPSSDVELFYERLAGGATATTAPPSPGELLEAYRALADRGADEVLSVHLDRRLSGTAVAADLAADESLVPVSVVDLPTASFGVGLCVREAVMHLSTGAAGADATRAARELASRLRNAFVAPTARGGRIASRGGWAVLELAEAVTGALAATGTPEDAAAVMVELVSESERPVRAAVGHASGAIRDAADELATRLAAAGVEVERYRIGPAVGAHTGGLSFGVFWWPASEG